MTERRPSPGGLGGSSLARLARPRPEDATRNPAVAGTLARFLKPRERPAPGEACELCAEPIGDEHAHLVNVDTRSLACVDRACYLLFNAEGTSGQKYRAVPDRVRTDPGFRLDAGQWDAFQIPVGMAFFFHNSRMQRTVAFYPSPAGATESELPLATWEELVAANPMVREMLSDVEGLLVRRERDATEAYVVPIDVCYELTGIIRRDWRGFGGGETARASIGAFFDGLRARARVETARA